MNVEERIDRLESIIHHLMMHECPLCYSGNPVVLNTDEGSVSHAIGSGTTLPCGAWKFHLAIAATDDEIRV